MGLVVWNILLMEVFALYNPQDDLRDRCLVASFNGTISSRLRFMSRPECKPAELVSSVAVNKRPKMSPNLLRLSEVEVCAVTSNLLVSCHDRSPNMAGSSV